MPGNQPTGTAVQLGAAVHQAMQAHEILDTTLDMIEGRQPEPTEAQLLALLSMARDGIRLAQNRLHHFSLSSGSCLHRIVADAIEAAEKEV